MTRVLEEKPGGMEREMERIRKGDGKLARFRAELLNLSVTDIWGGIILCGCALGRLAATLALTC